MHNRCKLDVKMENIKNDAPQGEHSDGKHESKTKPALSVGITTKIKTKIDRDGIVVDEKILKGHFGT